MHKLCSHSWSSEWQARHDCRQTKLWLPLPDPNKSSKILSHNRRMVSLITQFITGFSNISYHTLNKKEIILEDATCRLCLSAIETSWHLATDCQALALQSRDIFGPDGPENSNWDPTALVTFMLTTQVNRLLRDRVEPPPEEDNHNAQEGSEHPSHEG